MALLSPPFAAQVVALWAVAAYLGFKLLKVGPERPRIELKCAYPTPGRANLTAVFRGQQDKGPFYVRARLISGSGLALTRDSVDGLPDAYDQTELVTPMEPVPLGDNLHRTVGMIGVDSKRPRVKGRVRVQIFGAAGRPVAAVIHDF